METPALKAETVRTAVAPVASVLMVMSKRVGCLNHDSVSQPGSVGTPSHTTHCAQPR
jgi:hypothetical protein